MLDPTTGSELDIDTSKAMVDELIKRHGNWLLKFNGIRLWCSGTGVKIR